MRLYYMVIVLGSLLVLGLSNLSQSADKLDEQLLEDLNNELLEGIDESVTGPAADGNPTDDESDTSGKASDDPLIRIGQRMRSVERLIDQQGMVAKAQQLQQGIVQDLAELIKQLEERQSKCQGGSCSKPSSAAQGSKRGSAKQPQGTTIAGKPNDKPARESSQRLGKNDVRKPDMAEMQGLMKDVWGQLPAHTREQMLQSPPEQFLPKYELLLEKYYKRLSEKQKKQP